LAQAGFAFAGTSSNHFPGEIIMLFRASLVAIVASFAVSSAQATMFSLAPNADAYIANAIGSTNTNFGTLAQIQIKNDGADPNHRKGYFRYDLSTLPSGDIVTSAALNLAFVESGAGTLLNGTNTFEVFGLNDGVAGETWGESTITWNNAPANAAGGTAVTASASSLGTFSITGHTGNVNFLGSGGNAVQNFLANSTSNDLVTFIVVRLNNSVGGTQNYVHAINANEAIGGTGAFLNIVTEPLNPAPEPSTGLLLSLAVCVLMPQVRRRRKA
jgi:hypothetical protein